MTGNEIRRQFLEYFKKHSHQQVRSSSLVPQDDLDATQKRNRKLLRISQAITVLQAFRIRGR